MKLEGMPRFRELHGDTLDFIMAASPEQLLAIVAGTAARDRPLVQNFNNAQADDLRRMIIRDMRRHADFRGMVIRSIARMQPQRQGSKAQEPKKGKQPPTEKKEK
jgi:hypothetical protein